LAPDLTYGNKIFNGHGSFGGVKDFKTSLPMINAGGIVPVAGSTGDINTKTDGTIEGTGTNTLTYAL
jgi:hypothetical protein